MEKKQTTEGDTWKSLNYSEKIRVLLKNVTVEPLLACYFIPITLTTFATENINLEKACRVNLKYNLTVCDAISQRRVENYSEEVNAVQIAVAQMSAWKNALRYSLPAILILFIGSWSDRHARRKPLLLLPLLGELVSCIGLILCTYFYYEWPLEIAGVMEGLFPAMTGSNILMVMATFSYIGDITSDEDRTFRIGVVNMFVFLGAPIGLALGGFLLTHISFYGVFSIAVIFYAIGFTYCILKIKESKEPGPLPKGFDFITDFFNPTHLVETFSVLVKKREKNGRLITILLVIAIIIIIGPTFGESVTSYLFMVKRFNWDAELAGYYGTYSILLNFVGTLLAAGLLSKILKFDDSLIGCLSCIGGFISNLMAAFISVAWLFWIVPLVNLLGPGSLMALRSIASKVVPSNELGKLFSLFGIGEAVAPFVFSPLFSLVYASTIDSFPGCFFLIGCGFTILALMIFVWLHRLKKKHIYVDGVNKNNDSQLPPHVNEAYEEDHL